MINDMKYFRKILINFCNWEVTTSLALNKNLEAILQIEYW